MLMISRLRQQDQGGRIDHGEEGFGDLNTQNPSTDHSSVPAFSKFLYI
jgi:hypothetical protein